MILLIRNGKLWVFSFLVVILLLSLHIYRLNEEAVTRFQIYRFILPSCRVKWSVWPFRGYFNVTLTHTLLFYRGRCFSAGICRERADQLSVRLRRQRHLPHQRPFWTAASVARSVPEVFKAASWRGLEKRTACKRGRVLEVQTVI